MNAITSHVRGRKQLIINSLVWFLSTVIGLLLSVVFGALSWNLIEWVFRATVGDYGAAFVGGTIGIIVFCLGAIATIATFPEV